MLISDPKSWGLAFLGGIIPSLIWLWFWLKEDKKRAEPKGLLTIIFIVGMASVFFVLPVQKLIQTNINSHEGQIILWASVEEIIKLLVVIFVLYRSNRVDEPLDWPIYMITAALGFAALENTLFLVKPIALNEVTVGLLTSQLRFLGSTLLHTVSSGTVGIALGLSFHMNKWIKKWYLAVGFLFAVTLHSVFNFFIIKNSGSDFLKVFAFLWVVTIIIMLLFEKLRRMN